MVVDPHDGKSIGIKPPVVTADVVLITHNHFDHNASRVVRGDAKIIDYPFDGVEKGIRIKSFETCHDEHNGEKRGLVRAYRFTMDGIRFLHLGDIGHLPPDSLIQSIGKIDILFIPVGNVFTIGGKMAWEIITKLKPRVAIPMHYRVGGLSLSIKPVDQFLENVPKDRIIRVGNEVTFEKEDLPESLEIWVFSL